MWTYSGTRKIPIAIDVMEAFFTGTGEKQPTGLLDDTNSGRVSLRRYDSHPCVYRVGMH